MQDANTTETIQEISDFLRFIYGEGTGFCYIASKNPNQQQQFKQHFFAYPNELELASTTILAETQTSEVYYAPSLFREKSAKKESFASASSFWVEFDGNAPSQLNGIPEPSLRIKSSQDGHEHWYWKSDSPLDVDTLETVNRQLTYALGADVSGWDAGQILRPPRTFNHKRQLPVEVISKSDKKYNKAEFGGLPEAPPLLSVSLPESLPPVEDCIASTPFTASLWSLFKEGISEKGDRSNGLMALGYGLAELGVPANDIFSLLLNADARWGKFANRADRMVRLAEIVTRAKDKYPNGSSGITLQDSSVELHRFGFLDLLNSDIQLEWVWEKYLQKEGYLLITGPPGTGKTQLSLNLSQHFCLGKDFLGEKIDTQRNIAFFSLEMGPADLKHFIQYQRNGYTDGELKILNERLSLYPLGEPLYLSDTKERDRVERLISDLSLDGIVVDSLGSITDDELTNEKQIKNLMNWIDYVRRKYGIFVILIHHHRKASGDNKKPNKLSDVYGSFFITRNATTVLCLWDQNGKLQGIPLKVRLAAKPSPFGLIRNEHLLFEKSDITVAEQEALVYESNKPEPGESLKDFTPGGLKV